ncbi:hypothetical protein MKX03_012106 [Papaver bracteatum]|nr:hypothetical protein MKX03_012106 [Papaver bracteatum]
MMLDLVKNSVELGMLNEALQELFTGIQHYLFGLSCDCYRAERLINAGQLAEFGFDLRSISLALLVRYFIYFCCSILVNASTRNIILGQKHT